MLYKTISQISVYLYGKPIIPTYELLFEIPKKQDLGCCS